jgi:hypothetical protein
VFANLRAILEKAGSSLDRVVKTTVFLTSLADFPGMNEVYRRHVGVMPPARSTVRPPRVRPAYECKANLYDLAPTADMIARRQSGTLIQEKFVAEYGQQLERIGLPKIFQQLTLLQGGASGIVLLCFEDVSVDESCHHRMLADWLRRQAGLAVAELPDPSRKKTQKKAAPVRRGEHQ